MESEYYSVEELTKILKLHPKTIVRFIHEGKIKAQKIGRSWRISREALKTYTHAELAFPVVQRDEPHYETLAQRMKISSVIEITDQNSEEASRLANSITAALNTKDPSWGQCRFDSFYYPEIRVSKFVLYGSAQFMSQIMHMIDVLSTGDSHERL